jgi:hypothetical protein
LAAGAFLTAAFLAAGAFFAARFLEAAEELAISGAGGKSWSVLSSSLMEEVGWSHANVAKVKVG